ncbi:MAG: hypothetical protein ACKO4R_07870, partial [Synechococcales cyanobacterium]
MTTSWDRMIFLPSAIEQLSEPTSVALAQSIQIEEMITPLSPQPIRTSYVVQGSGNTPILLIHGFD